MKPARSMQPHLRLGLGFFAASRAVSPRSPLNAFSVCRFGMDRDSKARLLSCRSHSICKIHARHGGQALVEGIVVLLALLSLWVAISWLGRFQDMALQASHASRFAAFSLTRNPGAPPIIQSRTDYFSGPDHQWMDRRGQSMLSKDRSEVTFKVVRQLALEPGAQPGGASARAQELRQGWRLEDTGILKAYAIVAPPHYPALARHTALLVGAGHASDDIDSQRRLAESPAAWSDSANRSYELGRRIESGASALDRAWGRSEPRFDWLGPWAGYVPAHHLGEFQGDNN
ncbi:MAG: hypothetical protein ABI228_01745 [Burkholderiaceae bacterium]